MHGRDEVAARGAELRRSLASTGGNGTPRPGAIVGERRAGTTGQLPAAGGEFRGATLGVDRPMAAVAGHLVLAARSGDSAAFARLVHSETPAAYRLALSIVRSPAEAENAVQEAFLRAWRDIGHLREPELWPAWFRRLTVRSALDQTRRRPPVRELDLETAIELPGAEPSLPAADRLELMAAFDRLSADD